MTEGAYAGYHTDMTVPINPWDAEAWPGTSSSGSGVATAAGLCYGSIGSDTVAKPPSNARMAKSDRSMRGAVPNDAGDCIAERRGPL